MTTPTDILGQHIHLVKFDVTSSDGSGNGWNYEDGTFGGRGGAGAHLRHPPGPARPLRRGADRVHLRRHADDQLPGAEGHPFFNQFRTRLQRRNDFLGAQTTMQRWWADPILNQDGTGRTLRTIFTHDHFGPSTHQQTGLYAGLVIEPAGSIWYHNETGVQLGTNNGTPSATTAAPPPGRRSSTARPQEQLPRVHDRVRRLPAGLHAGRPGLPEPESRGRLDRHPARAVNPPGRRRSACPISTPSRTECPVPDGGQHGVLPPPAPRPSRPTTSA